MRVLNMAHNKLQSKKVQGGAFRQSRALECIDLQENDLHRVPSLPKTITDLNLAGNRIEKLDKERIMRLTSLQKLNLDNNKIRRLPLEIFVKSSQLEALSMANNRLEEIPKMLPCSLKKLNLESNQIHEISLGTFVSCQMLEEIHLKGNPLVPSTAKNSAFGVLKRLQVITIDWDFQRHEEVAERTRKKVKSRVTRLTNLSTNLSSLVPPV